MKLLFLPDLPDLTNPAICNKLKELLVNNTNIVFYLTPIQFYLMAVCRSYNETLRHLRNIIPAGTERNRILVAAANSMILELGDFYQKDRLKTKNFSCKYAVPGNYTYDFIPSVINYYQKNNIAIDDVTVILENVDTIQSKKRIVAQNIFEQDIEFSKKRLKELKKYIQDNNINYLTSNNWEDSILEIEPNSVITGHSASISNIDLSITSRPFFERANLPQKLSVLFTDRDKTFLVNSKEESCKNFELIKRFLELGNIIAIITSSNHEATLFEESKRAQDLWNMIIEYKNQVIGFPALQAGITLGGTKIPVGHAAIFKNGVTEKVIDMLLENGYELENIFSIGDAAQDLDMIIETAFKFNGVGYHIRKDNEVLTKYIGLNHFKEEHWDYIKEHGIDSFTTFMEQHVLTTINNQKRLKR